VLPINSSISNPNLQILMVFNSLCKDLIMSHSLLSPNRCATDPLTSQIYSFLRL
jgi:hypothetical protein